MEGLIIRVEHYGDNTTHMFQVPPSIEVGILKRMVSRTLGWERLSAGKPVSYQVEAQQLSRVMRDNEILSQAGILDNYLLVFHSSDNRPPVSTAPLSNRNTADLPAAGAVTAPQVEKPVSKQETPPVPVRNESPPVVIPEAANVSPVSGWRTLDVNVPPSASDLPPDDADDSQNSGFVWRKLD